MARIPDLRIASPSSGVSGVVQETNMFQLGQMVADETSHILERKENRDADAWMIKADEGLQLGALEDLDRATVESEDPNNISQSFFDIYQQRASKLLESAPNDAARSKFQERFVNLRSQYGKQALSTQVSETQKYRINNVESGIDSAVNHIITTGDYDTAKSIIDSTIKNAESFTSPSQLQTLRKTSMAQAKTANIDYLFRKGELDQAESLLIDPDYNKDIQSNDMIAFTKAIEDQRIEIQKQQNLISSIESGDFIDPKDKENKKAIDLIYNQNLSQALASGDGNAYQNTINLIEGTGIIPDTLQGQIRGAYVSNDMASKAKVYQIVNDVNSISPNVLELSGITEKQVTEAVMYTQLKDDGVPEQDAFRMIKNDLYPENPSIIELRKQEIIKNDLSVDIGGLFNDLSVDIVGLFDEDVIDYPEKVEAYKAKYKQLYNKYYLDTGNEDIAKRRATQVFKKNHGLSKITNDDEYVTDFPAEKYYYHPSFNDQKRGDLTYLWMRDQLVDSVSESLNNKDISYEDLIMVPDYVTHQEIKKGIPPTYQVFVKTEDEGLQFVNRIAFDLKSAVEDRKKYLKEGRKKAKIRQDATVQQLLDTESIINKRFP
jgi:hypothetical protein